MIDDPKSQLMAETTELVISLQALTVEITATLRATRVILPHIGALCVALTDALEDVPTLLKSTTRYVEGVNLFRDTFSQTENLEDTIVEVEDPTPSKDVERVVEYMKQRGRSVKYKVFWNWYTANNLKETVETMFKDGSLLRDHGIITLSGGVR